MTRWILAASVALNIVLILSLNARDKITEQTQKEIFTCQAVAQSAIFSINNCKILMDHFHEIVKKREVVECNRPSIIEAYRKRK